MVSLHRSPDWRDLPVVRPLLRRRYVRNFAQARYSGCMYGDYASFADAAAAVPDSRPVGYDVPGTSEMYRERITQVLPRDYPALYWLSKALPGARKVFDLGGHVGILYYSYSRYLGYRDDLVWQVCDVPAIVTDGEALAREMRAPHISFTTDLADMAGADVVFASGVLQYLERTLDDMLAALPVKPTHIVMNQTPTHPDREIITLQNIGPTICPYRIARLDSIGDSLRALGYEQVDMWEDPLRRTEVPYVTDAKTVAYSGFYFRLQQPA